MPPTKRGILFELQTAVASNADAAFEGIERKINELQGKATITIGVTHDLRSGSSHGPESASTTAAGRESDNAARMRRRQHLDEDERMRVSAERTAAQIEKINRETNENQIKDLRRATTEREKIVREQHEKEVAAAKAAQKEKAAIAKQEADEWKALSDIGGSAMSHSRKMQAGMAGLSDIGRAASAGTGNAKWAAGLSQLQNQTTGWSGLSAIGKDAMQHHQEAMDRQQKASAEADKEHRRHVAEADKEHKRHVAEADKEHKRHVAEVKEQYNKLTESIVGSTEAVTRLGEGIAYLGLIGEKDLHGLTDGLLRIRGTVDAIRGTVESMRDITGLFRNLSAVHQMGGATGVIRSFFGMGPAAIPAAAGHLAGTGAVTGAAGAAAAGAGTSIAPVAAAPAAAAGIGLALPLAAIATAMAGAAHIATEGRSTRQFGRGLHGIQESTSNFIYNVQRRYRTLGMDKDERAQEAEREMHMEDPNNPRGGFYNPLGLGYIHNINAAAARRRNAERQEQIRERRDRERELRQRIEESEVEPVMLQLGQHQEERQRESEVAFRTKMVETSHHATDFFLKQQNTGLGTFMGGKATAIHDAGERGAFLLERKQSFMEEEAEKLRIQQRRENNQKSMQETVEQYAGHNLSEGSSARKEFEERIAQLLKEEAQIAAESDRQRLKSQQDRIQGMQRELQILERQAKTSLDASQAATDKRRSVEVALGQMNPMQIAALARTRKRAEAGEELTHYERQQLLNAPDQESRFRGEQASIKFFRDTLKNHGFKKDDIIGAEIAHEEAAERQQQRDYGAVTKAREQIKQEGQVMVGGGFTIAVDIRADEGLSEEFAREREGIEGKLKNVESNVYKEVYRIVNAMAARMNAERKQMAAGSE